MNHSVYKLKQSPEEVQNLLDSISSLAKSEDLTDYAKNSDLAAYAKKSDLDRKADTATLSNEVQQALSDAIANGDISTNGNMAFIPSIDNKGNLTWSNDRESPNPNSIDLFKSVHGLDGHVVTPQMFGAKADGVADDTAAIQDAIDHLPKDGGTVYFPPGTYCISRPIVVGNGYAHQKLSTSYPNGGNPSSVSAIKLIGCASSTSHYNSVLTGDRPTTSSIKPIGDNSSSDFWTPLKNSNGTTPNPPKDYIDNGVQDGNKHTIRALIFVRGAIANVHIKNLYLNCDGKAETGLYISAASDSVFENVKIYNPTYAGVKIMGGHAQYIDGEPQLGGNYCVRNSFRNIFVHCKSNGSYGLFINGYMIERDDKDKPYYSVSNDTWITSFDNCRFENYTQDSSDITMGYFKFVDSITFRRCHFYNCNVDKNSCRGVVFHTTETNDHFPSAMAFYDCSISDMHTWITTGCTMQPQYFIGHGTWDNEKIPINNRYLIGITDTGKTFGGWGKEEYTSEENDIKSEDKAKDYIYDGEHLWWQ